MFQPLNKIPQTLYNKKSDSGKKLDKDDKKNDSSKDKLRTSLAGSHVD